MGLFEPWYLNRHLGITLDDEQKSVLDSIYDVLVESALNNRKFLYTGTTIHAI